MESTRNYNIKYPFTLNNEEGYFVDINKDIREKIASDILHVVLTRKRTRIRRPDFGTSLMDFVFEENHEKTWDDVKTEVTSAVAKYVRNVTMKDVEVYRDNENGLFLMLYYDTTIGNETVQNKLTLKI